MDLFYEVGALKIEGLRRLSRREPQRLEHAPGAAVEPETAGLYRVKDVFFHLFGKKADYGGNALHRRHKQRRRDGYAGKTPGVGQGEDSRLE